jgi:hypothetical protein
MPDKYIGWGTNTRPVLDPKVGPKTKAFLNSGGKFRPYVGGEIVHKEELLLGLGVIYYAGKEVSFEIGYRDSVFKDDKLLEEYRDNAQRINSWDDMNPMFYIGGVLIW